MNYVKRDFLEFCEIAALRVPIFIMLTCFKKKGIVIAHYHFSNEPTLYVNAWVKNCDEMFDAMPGTLKKFSAGEFREARWYYKLLCNEYQKKPICLYRLSDEKRCDHAAKDEFEYFQE